MRRERNRPERRRECQADLDGCCAGLERSEASGVVWLSARPLPSGCEAPPCSEGKPSQGPHAGFK